MSINVTVHGNPISIKRGKMVALDDNKEFEVRRKIRIQQVRQQSKKIAENVRNKVRREKDKQLGKFNCDADAEHEVKKSCNINCLNKNLRQSYEDFGQAYRDAEDHPDEEEILQEQTAENARLAQIRGKCASVALKQNQNYQKYLSSKHNEDLKYARYIEDVRSKLVADLPRKRKLQVNVQEEKKSSTNGSFEDISDISINITDPTKTSTIPSRKNSDTQKAPCRDVWDKLHPEKTSFEKKYSEKNGERRRSSERKTAERNSNSEKKSFERKNFKRSSETKNSENSLDRKSFERKDREKDSKSSVRRNPESGFERKDSGVKIPIRRESRKSQQSDTSNKENITNPSNLSISPSVQVPYFKEEDLHNEWYSQFVKHKEETIEFGPFETIETTEAFEIEETDKEINDPSEEIEESDYEDNEQTEEMEETNMEIPYHPVLESRRTQGKKSKPSPDRLLTIKKTLRSNKQTKVPKTDLITTNLEKISPIKVKKTLKKKKVKRKSSLHDTNYVKPTLVFDTCQSNVLNVCPRLPKVPTTSIKDNIPEIKGSTVKCYDRFNKFFKEETQPMYVQKISEEDLVIRDDESECNPEICSKKIQQAKVRGAKAMEKLKIEKDYQRLLRDLPILEKQERLASMQSHKPSIHMTNERYKECERRKQNQLECNFENLQSRAEQFNKPTITLKSIRKSPPKPCQKLEISTCTNESCTEFETPSKESTSTSSESSKCPCSEDQIADLLKRVNKQRELLLKEAVNMKALGHLKNVLNEEELINIICKCPPKKKYVETATSPFQTSQTKSKRGPSSSNSDTSTESHSRHHTRPKVKKFKIYMREEGTQTSPSVSKVLKPKKVSSAKSIKTVRKHSSQSARSVPSRPSKSSSTSDKVCEIIIRADQNVQINPIVEERASQTCKEKDVIIKIKEAGVGIESCIKNLLNMSTSTSYFSPPIAKSNKPSLESCRNTLSNKHLLQPQRQQTNLEGLVRVENGSKQINPRLVKYITRLLNMSRQSIDELTVSSVSDVSTPQESIIQTASNMAKEKLQTVMEHFRLSADDIRNLCLSSSSISNETLSSEKQGKQFVSAATCTEKNEKDEGIQVCLRDSPPKPRESQSKKRDSPPDVRTSRRDSQSKSRDSPPDIKTSRGDSQWKSDNPSRLSAGYPVSSSLKSSKSPPRQASIKFCIPKTDTSTDPYCMTDSSCTKKGESQKTTSSDDALKNPENFLEFVRESLGMSVEEFAELGFEEMFSRHMELTEYCHDRIKSLMQLIEQIRQEKRDICSSPVDNSVTLTSYLDLPPSSKKSLKDESIDKELTDCIQSCLEQEVSSESSLSQDAIDRYLLGIAKVDKSGKSTRKSPPKDPRLSSGEENIDSKSFVPMLDGIPKYTAEVPNILADLLKQVSKNRPPPSLLRSNMKGHTNEVPHELSTIVEMDTMGSSRNTTMRPKSPDIPKKLVRDKSPEEKVPSRDISPRIAKKAIRDKSPEEKIPSRDISPKNHRSPNSSDGYVTIPYNKTIEVSDSGTKSGISGIVSLSESSQETPDELEAMLKKFKLEWAISLVKKTEQAMALSSSSSSSDVKDVSVDMRDKFKSLCKKLASLNESDVDKAQLVSDLSQFKDFHDISEISGTNDPKSKSQQRTSTPVQFSKSGDSTSQNKKSLTNESFFKVDSELSSVKNSSDENSRSSNLFLSIPNITLNTEHISLRKS